MHDIVEKKPLPKKIDGCDAAGSEAIFSKYSLLALFSHAAIRRTADLGRELVFIRIFEMDRGRYLLIGLLCYVIEICFTLLQ